MAEWSAAFTLSTVVDHSPVLQAVGWVTSGH